MRNATEQRFAGVGAPRLWQTSATSGLYSVALSHLEVPSLSHASLELEELPDYVYKSGVHHVSEQSQVSDTSGTSDSLTTGPNRRC